MIQISGKSLWILFKTYLSPGRQYGILISPRSDKGPVFLGPLVLITKETSEEWLREHYEPILKKLEENYDEEFQIDTKIKIKDMGESSASPSAPPSSPSSNQDFNKPQNT